jgi:diphosphomevalonate decarboxylase
MDIHILQLLGKFYPRKNISLKFDSINFMSNDNLKKLEATALACSNLALIKYWGKQNIELNTPAVGSISITLDALTTTTTVCFDSLFKKDIFKLNRTPAGYEKEKRVSKFLDLIRKHAKLNLYAEVISENNFPTGAGLASSASGFAALAMAATNATNLSFSPDQLSAFARRGSGSAARSVYGGFVEMKVGKQKNGSDSIAFQIADEKYWPLNVFILLTTEIEKAIGSTAGMQHTANTSPFYKNWVNSSKRDLSEMRDAIKKKDFTKLGELSEFSCLKMHALAMAAKPGIIYWNSTTIELIHRIREMRKEGLESYFTIDAGPQVKVLCQANDVNLLKKNLLEIPGVKKMILSGLGPGAKLLEKNS